MRKMESISGYENYNFLTPNDFRTTDDTTVLLEGYRDTIADMLHDPVRNYKSLREISLMLYNSNGIITNTINYLSGLYTYDYYIYPNFKADMTNAGKSIEKNFFDSANLLDKMNVKETFQQIMQTIMIEGMGFYYEVVSPNKINLRKIPYDFCKITYSEGGVCRYAVNLLKINVDNVNRFPKEIQKAWEKYRTDRTLPHWYQVSNKGVAFTTDDSLAYGLPYFTFLIDSVDRFEKAKERSDKKDDLNILKLIHQKIPVDTKTQKPALPIDMVDKFHRATKDNLPKTVSITTNPLDLNAISFEDSNNDNDIIERATKELWNTSGLSNQLFNNTNNSAEALRKNVIVNQILLKRFFNSFNIYINTKIVSKKHSFTFLGITEMNRKEWVDSASKSLGFGGSRLYALACQGLTPLQAINLLKLEQEVLDIDSLMLPKDTSYTISSNGRPSSEDKGETVSESREDAINRGDD